MKQWLYEIVVITNHYPKTKYIFAAGLIISSVVALIGNQAVTNFELSGPTAMLQETIRKILAENYLKLVMGTLVMTIFATVQQFSRDRKKFNRRF